MDFVKFKKQLNKQFAEMAKGELFKTDVTKDQLWDTYIGSFPEGTNPIYVEKTEHDCNCCKSFIRKAGNVVSIVDGELVSIWDIELEDEYQVVADAMSTLVKSAAIRDIFLNDEHNLGTDHNHAFHTGIRWEHFHFKLPSKFVMGEGSIAYKRGIARDTKNVFQRGLDDITMAAAEIVVELSDQKTICRGEEHMPAVERFIKHKIAYDKLPEEHRSNYCWLVAAKEYKTHNGGSVRINNNLIGTVLNDISEGKDLEHCVRAFNKKNAPGNFKHPKTIATPAMIEKAQKRIKELGYMPSLPRRFAVLGDITVNNLRYVDRETRKEMDVFDELIQSAPDKVKNLDKVEEVTIENFMQNILPKAEELEVRFENRHASNLMSLIAPVNSDAPNLLKWDNNFSWAYTGNVTDSMKEHVKAAGGKVDGDMRFSIIWNEEGEDPSIDFDAHVHEPNGNHIYYQKVKERQLSSAMLDVDNTQPGAKIAVENVAWINKNNIQKGRHKFNVHNYSNRASKGGFRAEIEYLGTVYEYVHSEPLGGKETVQVAVGQFSDEFGLEIITSMPSTKSTKEVWGINTEKFHKVNAVMDSPNYWDDNKTGNRHLFFMLEGCNNPDRARGLYNEFLNEELYKDRKVFEMLGNKMRTEHSDEQLSGLGFSSTLHNDIIVRVKGSFTRELRIKF